MNQILDFMGHQRHISLILRSFFHAEKIFCDSSYNGAIDSSYISVSYCSSTKWDFKITQKALIFFRSKGEMRVFRISSKIGSFLKLIFTFGLLFVTYKVIQSENAAEKLLEVSDNFKVWFKLLEHVLFFSNRRSRLKQMLTMPILTRKSR